MTEVVEEGVDVILIFGHREKDGLCGVGEGYAADWGLRNVSGREGGRRVRSHHIPDGLVTIYVTGQSRYT